MISKEVRKFLSKAKNSKNFIPWLFSCLSGLLLVFLTLLGDHLQYDWGGEEAIMKRIEIFRNLFNKEKEVSDGSDSFLAVNVGFDREFVVAYDEYGIPAGNRAVVNRHSLLRFLDSIQNSQYRCILIDVLLFNEDKTDVDSILFARINNTPKIVVVSAENMLSDSKIDSSHLAKAEYGITLDENNFVKYHFESNVLPDAAVATYNIITGKKTHFSGLFSFDEGRLASNSLTLSLPYRIESTYDEEGNKILFNLGTDILDIYDKESLAELVRDKTVIIGDYTGGDNHDTYVGEMQGPVIIMNAINALLQGRHIINIWVMFLMFILFCLIVFFIISNPARFLPKGIVDSKFWRFLTMFIGYTSFVIIMNVLIYLITDVMHDMFLPEIYLSIIFFIVDKRFHKKNIVSKIKNWHLNLHKTFSKKG